MTTEHEALIDSLKEKIRTLISLYESAKAENDYLKADKQELIGQLAGKDDELKELERKYEVLKMAKSLSGAGSGGHEAKLKVNRIVRDIDKCIALLNK